MRRLALVFLLAVLACQGAPATGTEVALYEFGIDSGASTFAAGEVTFDLHNTGSFGHTLVVTDAEGNVVDAGDLLAPSDRSTVTLDLEPGEYQLTCRIIGQDSDGNIVDHYEQGMMTSITVERS